MMGRGGGGLHHSIVVSIFSLKSQPENKYIPDHFYFDPSEKIITQSYF